MVQYSCLRWDQSVSCGKLENVGQVVSWWTVVGMHPGTGSSGGGDDGNVLETATGEQFEGEN